MTSPRPVWIATAAVGRPGAWPAMFKPDDAAGSGDSAAAAPAAALGDMSCGRLSSRRDGPADWQQLVVGRLGATELQVQIPWLKEHVHIPWLEEHAGGPRADWSSGFLSH